MSELRRLGLIGGTSWVSSEHYYSLRRRASCLPRSLRSGESCDAHRKLAGARAGAGSSRERSSRRGQVSRIEQRPLGPAANTTHLAANGVRTKFTMAVVDKLVAAGAEAVVLACTKQGMLLRDGDAAVPLIDTTVLHCAALTEFVLGGNAS